MFTFKSLYLLFNKIRILFDGMKREDNPEEELVNKSILDSLLFIKENPGAIWSEYDLQTIISLYLMKVPEFTPDLIHREYPYMAIKSENREKERAHKSDIVIFSKDDVCNINDLNGYLIVHGENRDGDRIKSEKRAVYCTHLFELKTKRERFKQGVLDDFRLLRKGSFYYREASPELYSICYFYWNPTKNKIQIYTDIIEGIDELFTKTFNDPKINLLNLRLLLKTISSLIKRFKSSFSSNITTQKQLKMRFFYEIRLI